MLGFTGILSGKCLYNISYICHVGSKQVSFNANTWYQDVEGSLYLLCKGQLQCVARVHNFGFLSVWSDHHSCQCFVPVFTFSSNPHLYCYFFLIQQRIYPSVDFFTFSWVLTTTFSAWCTYSSRDSYLISFLEAGVVGPNCGVIAFCTKGDQHRTVA